MLIFTLGLKNLLKLVGLTEPGTDRTSSRAKANTRDGDGGRDETTENYGFCGIHRAVRNQRFLYL